MRARGRQQRHSQRARRWRRRRRRSAHKAPHGAALTHQQRVVLLVVRDALQRCARAGLLLIPALAGVLRLTHRARVAHRPAQPLPRRHHHVGDGVRRTPRLRSHEFGLGLGLGLGLGSGPNPGAITTSVIESAAHPACAQPRVACWVKRKTQREALGSATTPKPTRSSGQEWVGI
jgi:hypothetical protein